MKKDYPIIEFDGVSPTVIDVSKNIGNETLPRKCVISFFGDAVKKIVEQKNAKKIASLVLESFELPIYLLQTPNGSEIALIHGLGSSPYAAGQIEKLYAMGCREFMICGGCGVLSPGSTVGDVFVPYCALRDEGTSYHYVEPSREIFMDNRVLDFITSYLNKNNISYKKVKTWTTDSMYRETERMIQFRREEQCDVVEMECSAFFAVGQYKHIKVGQILYAGDDLSKKEWDHRDWKEQYSIREYILLLTVDMCGEM